MKKEPRIYPSTQKFVEELIKKNEIFFEERSSEDEIRFTYWLAEIIKLLEIGVAVSYELCNHIANNRSYECDLHLSYKEYERIYAIAESGSKLFEQMN